MSANTPIVDRSPSYMTDDSTTRYTDLETAGGNVFESYNHLYSPTMLRAYEGAGVSNKKFGDAAADGSGLCASAAYDCTREWIWEPSHCRRNDTTVDATSSGNSTTTAAPNALRAPTTPPLCTAQILRDEAGTFQVCGSYEVLTRTSRSDTRGSVLLMISVIRSYGTILVSTVSCAVV